MAGSMPFKGPGAGRCEVDDEAAAGGAGASLKDTAAPCSSASDGSAVRRSEARSFAIHGVMVRGERRRPAATFFVSSGDGAAGAARELR